MRPIDADALIERIKYSFHPNERVSIETVTGCFLDETGCAPTIDAESVQHGHWNDAEIIGVDQPTVRCSICGIRFCDLINNHRFMYKYCPHCGAKMDEVSE